MSAHTIGIANVLLVTNSRWWNAEVAYAYFLGLALQNKGITVHYIAMPDSPAQHKFATAGFTACCGVNLAKENPWQLLTNYRRLRAYLDDQAIDLVNTFQSRGSAIFSILRRQNKKFAYIRTRGDARPPRGYFLSRRSYSVQGCDGVICASHCVKAQFDDWLANGWLEQPNLGVVYYSCLPIRLDPSLSAHAAKHALGLPPKKLVYCLLGRNQEVKGHALALEAWRESKLLQSTAHLLFLIKDLEEFPENLQEMKRYIRDNRLEESISILGHCADLGAVFAAVDYGLVPSLGSEVNARATVEFFSAGIPVIASAVGSLPEVVNHGINGYICPKISAADLRSRLESSIEQHTDNFDSLKANALSSYHQYYTLESMFEETMRYWQQAIHMQEKFLLL